jgi:hypothetical protein
LNKVYKSDNSFFGEEPSNFALLCFNHVKANNAKKILELGAGHGRDTIFFASNGIEVDALDYSSVAIDILNNESRGLSQIKELLLGIVSHSIIKHANIPVLIIKRDKLKLAVTQQAMIDDIKSHTASVTLR